MPNFVARLFYRDSFCVYPQLHSCPLVQTPLRAASELQDMQKVDDQRGKGQKKGAGIDILITVRVCEEAHRDGRNEGAGHARRVHGGAGLGISSRRANLEEQFAQGLVFVDRLATSSSAKKEAISAAV